LCIQKKWTILFKGELFVFFALSVFLCIRLIAYIKEMNTVFLAFVHFCTPFLQGEKQMGPLSRAITGQIQLQ